MCVYICITKYNVHLACSASHKGLKNSTLRLFTLPKALVRLSGANCEQSSSLEALELRFGVWGLGFRVEGMGITTQHGRV